MPNFYDSLLLFLLKVQQATDWLDDKIESFISIFRSIWKFFLGKR